MLTKTRYSGLDFMYWSRNETYLLILYNILAVVLYHVFNYKFLQVPWTPIALLGTAVAFLIGFQSNAAYGRIWEARMIWGAIVNSSRTFEMKVKAMVNNKFTDNPVSEEELKAIRKTLIYRHIAWLTALRYAMREIKPWEEFYHYISNREFAKKNLYVPEKEEDFKTILSNYLSPEEEEYVLSKGNKSTTILNLQSKHLEELTNRGLIWDFSFLELENILEELFTQQGKSERIKNFPYPKQFSSLSFYVVWIFIAFLPFGLMSTFDDLGNKMAEIYNWGHYFIWTLVPFSVIVSWVFWIIQRVALVGDNPFEGSGNDVPISAIARGIEIDLRQQLDEDPNEIPKQFPEKNNIQM